MQQPSFLVAIILVVLSFQFVTPAESLAQSHTKGRQVAPFTPTLKAGDYVWHPEISPPGPVVVLVSLPDQVLYVAA